MSIDALFPQMVALSRKMRWDAREVVRDTPEGPQLYERITLTGPIFEQRAQEPFVAVGTTLASAVEIDEDGATVRAYFDQEIPGEEMIEFGYLSDGVVYRFPVEYVPSRTARLDKTRLPKEIRLLRRSDGEAGRP